MTIVVKGTQGNGIRSGSMNQGLLASGTAVTIALHPQNAAMPSPTLMVAGICWTWWYHDVMAPPRPIRSSNLDYATLCESVTQTYAQAYIQIDNEETDHITALRVQNAL
jgi:hypothetical protein